LSGQLVCNVLAWVQTHCVATHQAGCQLPYSYLSWSQP
jgi:hypothetical protein